MAKALHKLTLIALANKYARYCVRHREFFRFSFPSIDERAKFLLECTLSMRIGYSRPYYWVQIFLGE